MRPFAFATIAAIVAVTALPAAAQAQDRGRDDDTILVEGERVGTADVRNTARDVTIGSYSAQTPLSRYHRAFCPGLWGLTEEDARAVLDRVVFNAIEAGVPIDEEPDCGANAWIIVVDDPSETFERLREEDSFLTRHMTPYQVRTVRGDDGEALGWNLITTRNPDTGDVLPTGFQMSALAALAKGQPDGVYLQPNSSYQIPTNVISRSSRLDLGIREDIELSVVLVDRSALAGLDTSALADYATMRLLAETRPPNRDRAVSTVLALFTQDLPDAASPQRMTAFDRAYLRALYRSSPTRPARMALGNIAGAMEDIEVP